ncbi:uncharacterized protein LOC107814356 [Nicotiana tabacum]|uniref:Uncharacterized protein LOC107814356 n=1 Tax=Nicotiana tabacum TaxID=4097 RepID=A0AC58TDV2_TOBAC
MVNDFVVGCDICLRSKDDNMAYPGLLQPLLIPNQAWSHIIEGLPKSKNKEVILVVVDRMTKYAHFIALAHPYTAATVADVFWKRIHCLHGTPEFILSLGPILEIRVQEAEDIVMRRQQMQQLLKDNLTRLRSRMKYYANKRRSDREFQLGDMVYPVFHVSLLKKKVGDRVVVQTTLLITSDDGQFLVKPVAILQRQLIKRNNADVVRVLVQWSNLPPEDATWEDYQFLKAKFPDFYCNP